MNRSIEKWWVIYILQEGKLVPLNSILVPTIDSPRWYETEELATEVILTEGSFSREYIVLPITCISN